MPVAPGVMAAMVRIRSTAKAAATTAGCTSAPIACRHSQSSAACSAAYASLPPTIRPHPEETSPALSRRNAAARSAYPSSALGTKRTRPASQSARVAEPAHRAVVTGHEPDGERR